MTNSEELTRQILDSIDKSHLSVIDTLTSMTDAFGCLISATMVECGMIYNAKDKKEFMESVCKNLEMAVQEYNRNYIAMHTQSGC